MANNSERDVVSYGVLMDRTDMVALRMLAARRGMHVSQLFREVMRPLVDEAYRQWGKTLPPRPKES